MFQTKKMKSPLMLIALLLGTLLLSACGGADTSALEVSQADIATQAAVLQQDLVVQEDDPPSADGDTQVEAPVSDEPTGLPEVPRIDKGALWFEPVNPIGVVIASGELQMIEFSAYW